MIIPTNLMRGTRLSCVANTIADAMRSGHRPMPVQALRLASAARPQS